MSVNAPLIPPVAIHRTFYHEGWTVGAAFNGLAGAISLGAGLYFLTKEGFNGNAKICTAIATVALTNAAHHCVGWHKTRTVQVKRDQLDNISGFVHVSELQDGQTSRLAQVREQLATWLPDFTAPEGDDLSAIASLIQEMKRHYDDLKKTTRLTTQSNQNFITVLEQKVSKLAQVREQLAAWLPDFTAPEGDDLSAIASLIQEMKRRYDDLEKTTRLTTQSNQDRITGLVQKASKLEAALQSIRQLEEALKKSTEERDTALERKERYKKGYQEWQSQAQSLEEKLEKSEVRASAKETELVNIGAFIQDAEKALKDLHTAMNTTGSGPTAAFVEETNVPNVCDGLLDAINKLIIRANAVRIGSTASTPQSRQATPRSTPNTTPYKAKRASSLGKIVYSDDEG